MKRTLAAMLSFEWFETMGNLFVLYLVWPAKIKGKVGFCGFSLTPKAVKGVPNALMSSFHVAEEVSYRSTPCHQQFYFGNIDQYAGGPLGWPVKTTQYHSSSVLNIRTNNFLQLSTIRTNFSQNFHFLRAD